MASVIAFPRTTLEAPWSSASFAPAAEIILWKIMITMGNGFGCAGCIREKSARRADKSATRLPSHGQAFKSGQHYRMMIVLECMTAGAPSASQRRSRGAQACANAPMSIMWCESVPPENLVQSATPSGKTPST